MFRLVKTAIFGLVLLPVTSFATPGVYSGELMAILESTQFQAAIGPNWIQSIDIQGHEDGRASTHELNFKLISEPGGANPTACILKVKWKSIIEADGLVNQLGISRSACVPNPRGDTVSGLDCNTLISFLETDLADATKDKLIRSLRDVFTMKGELQSHNINLDIVDLSADEPVNCKMNLLWTMEHTSEGVEDNASASQPVCGGDLIARRNDGHELTTIPSSTAR